MQVQCVAQRHHTPVRQGMHQGSFTERETSSGPFSAAEWEGGRITSCMHLYDVEMFSWWH